MNSGPTVVLDRLGEDTVDLRMAAAVEIPAHHVLHRRQLIRAARAPERDDLAAVEQPADGERRHGLAVPLACEPVEPVDGREVVSVAAVPGI